MNNLNRRDFLKLSGAAAASLNLPAPDAPEAPQAPQAP